MRKNLELTLFMVKSFELFFSSPSLVDLSVWFVGNKLFCSLYIPCGSWSSRCPARCSLLFSGATTTRSYRFALNLLRNEIFY